MTIRAACAGFAAALMIASATWAEPVCLVCKGPTAAYSCEMQDAAGQPVASSPWQCAQRAAETEGHASCAAQSGTSCSGRPVVYRSDETADLATTPVASEAPLSVPQNDDLDLLARTTQAAREATSATTDAIGKAERAVTDATRRTMDCISSQFVSC